MANVSHATLTGADLHEPKGVATAATGQAYIANGNGSGAWTTITGLSFTGMIADFLAPSAPSGWLELDGSVLSSITYAALYNVMTVQQTGSRTGGSAVITGLASTTNIKAGYSVIGTGITAGTTVLSVDSSTQITMSANVSSSGSSTVIASPWVLGTNIITLPNATSAGYFRRSRTAASILGTAQTSQNLSHNHTLVAAEAASAGTHAHSITDLGHGHASSTSFGASQHAGLQNGTGVALEVLFTPITLTVDNSTTGISVNSGGAHTHNMFGSTDTSGSLEARPVAIVVLTCVKT